MGVANILGFTTREGLRMEWMALYYTVRRENATVTAQHLSRVRTPKDNPEVERFNETPEYEWLYNCNLSVDPEELNP